MSNCVVKENNLMKFLKSKDYNYAFNKKTGYFQRWGSNFEDNPTYSIFGPEILDLEISYGKCSGNCKFCYKDNGNHNKDSHNMTFDEFKIIFNKIGKQLTQIAFGITDIYSNPDFFKMMEYSKENGVIPNYTCNGFDVDDNAAKVTSETCGAVAVSLYSKEHTYNAIKKFTDYGMNQVNIHYVLSEETYDNIFNVFDDIKTDNRLAKLNSIIFLSYKPKGKNKNNFTILKDKTKYKRLAKYSEDNNLMIGFDSCSAPIIFKNFINEDDNQINFIKTFCESCESSCFSAYINAKGEYFPCSFCENEDIFKEGLNVLNCDDFLKDIWFNEKTIKFRNNLLNTTKKCDCIFQSECRTCPAFNIKCK